MIRLTAFLRDLFCLAHAHRSAGQAGMGYAFERRIERQLAAVGIRPVQILSGVRSLGSQSLSGLYHQIDATGRTREALVIGEWKSYRGAIRKNELLRFKAVTDDYWLGQHPHAIAPVIRVFGGTGSVSPELRRYAALWGICLITPDCWPAPILASGETYWPGKNPDTTERRNLAWLSRPIEAVCRPHRGGGWLIPSPPARPVVDRLIALQDHWSGQLWRRFNGQPGSFDQWVRDTIPWGAAA
jgi:hypothetical protein